MEKEFCQLELINCSISFELANNTGFMIMIGEKEVKDASDIPGNEANFLGVVHRYRVPVVTLWGCDESHRVLRFQV
ncbi:MAG: hypothetical protein HXS52_04815 [Theionarchaea archaeon]|nr:hypothetical protein [Theionarchaea archaeon]MBU7037228.1 hypothetical protein [Theionarchaea archaeon]